MPPLRIIPLSAPGVSPGEKSGGTGYLAGLTDGVKGQMSPAPTKRSCFDITMQELLNAALCDFCDEPIFYLIVF